MSGPWTWAAVESLAGPFPTKPELWHEHWDTPGPGEGSFDVLAQCPVPSGGRGHEKFYTEYLRPRHRD